MKLSEAKKERIAKAIDELKLSKEQLDEITMGDMKKICMVANVDTFELMWFLRYERDEK